MSFFRSTTKIFFSFLILSVAFPCAAQRELADSIKRVMGFSNDTSRVILLLRLSDAYSQYDLKKSIEPASEAKALSVQLGNDTLLARALQNIGHINFKMAHYDDAILNFEESIKTFKQIGLEKDAAAVLNSEADAYQSKGDFNEALNKSFDAYRICEKSNDKNGMAGSLIASAIVYSTMGNSNKAINDYEKAMTLSEEAGNLSYEATALGNLANIYGDKGDTAKALECYMKAKDIDERTGNKFALGKVMDNIGSTYEEMGQFDKAMDYLMQALAIQKQTGDEKGMAVTLANLGSTSADLGKQDQAISYMEQSYTIAKKIEASKLAMNILESTSQVYQKIGNPQKALEYYKKYSSMKDSLFNDKLSNSIAEMQAKYDVEKAENATRTEKKQKQLITIGAFIGGFLFLIIVFFLWNRAVVRKRTNVKLNMQKAEIENKNVKLHAANKEIELKNKDITDSIQYASRIQEAILPEVEFASTFHEKGFILYRPKDIVSGDFYWMAQTNDHLLFAAVDCTGHGVPGAFMSIVCSNLLTQSVKEHGITQPNEILNDVNIRLSETLRQRQDESRVRDGMDIALCCIHKHSNKLEFAGAYNPVFIFRGKEFIELSPDKFPVGLFVEEELKKFTHKEYALQKGDRLYIASDGYSDQFGGELGKKYKRSSFVDYLSKIQTEPFVTHRRLLEKEHLSWKGNFEQIDDVLVMGMEV
ncbi:MAG: tetratricopeptide repeat protein [Bacteroidetes bacterium]|nr:tetratricopeptide repeat protein [Bacteroidota bacterium]